MNTKSSEGCCDASQGDRAPGPSASAFQRAYETLSIPVLLVAEDGTIRHAAGSCERDLGWRPDQLIGHNIVEFIPEDYIESAVQSMIELGASQEIGIGVPTVYPICRPDKSLTWQAVGAVPLLDDPDVGAVSFYLLPWDAQLAFDDSIAASLAGAPIDEVLTLLSRSIAVSLEAYGAAIHYGFDGEQFPSCASFGIPPACLASTPDAPWLTAVKRSEPAYVGVGQLATDAQSSARAVGIAGLWAIPIPPIDGAEAAVVSVWRPHDLPPVTAHDFVIARSLRYVQMTLERAADHAQLKHLASHDHLTGVANRRLFNDRLEASLASGLPTIVLFCDLDAFKHVNDTLGHHLGDEVLVQTAQRLRAALPDDALLARMGGDEFTVLLNTSLAEAAEIAEALASAIEAPMDVDGTLVRIALSVGIAAAEAGSTPSGLLNRADNALYDVKRAGGSRIWTAPLPGSHPSLQ